MKKISVLFVCMGNICRSPTAHGVFRKLVEEAGLQDAISIDSAGTHAYHVGNPPDPRSMAKAIERGLDMSDLRARQAMAADFELFDYVLAMDNDNYQGLSRLCPPSQKHKLHMFMAFADSNNATEVPDPYYGGARGFDQVFDMVEEASAGLLDDIRQQLSS